MLERHSSVIPSSGSNASVAGIPSISSKFSVTVPRMMISGMARPASVPPSGIGPASISDAPHTLTTPPPPHLSESSHVPHATVRDAPQLSKSVYESQSLPLRSQNDWSLSGVQVDD